MLLSRFADNAFWMGRYVERTESLSRLLSVTESFAADQEGEAAWKPILQVFTDEKVFAERGRPVTALNVAKFYLADKDNSNSALYAVQMLKENARALRHLISTESWRQISVFSTAIETLSKRRFALSKLSELCDEIRHYCLSHRGVIEATWYRDEVWRFNRLGAALERADQMTRLLDMKYFDYDRDDEENVAPPDVAWWNTLLRSASGYHAFQRMHSFSPEPSDAAGFLLFDKQLPLSVAGAAGNALYQLEQLERDFDAKPGPAVKEAAKTLETLLENPPPRLNGRPLHKYLDTIQRDLIALANALDERYFSPQE